MPFEGRATLGWDHRYDAEVFYLGLALDERQMGDFVCGLSGPKPVPRRYLLRAPEMYATTLFTEGAFGWAMRRGVARGRLL